MLNEICFLVFFFLLQHATIKRVSSLMKGEKIATARWNSLLKPTSATGLDEKSFHHKERIWQYRY